MSCCVFWRKNNPEKNFAFVILNWWNEFCLLYGSSRPPAIWSLHNFPPLSVPEAVVALHTSTLHCLTRPQTHTTKTQLTALPATCEHLIYLFIYLFTQWHVVCMQPNSISVPSFFPFHAVEEAGGWSRLCTKCSLPLQSVSLICHFVSLFFHLREDNLFTFQSISLSKSALFLRKPTKDCISVFV